MSSLKAERVVSVVASSLQPKAREKKAMIDSRDGRLEERLLAKCYTSRLIRREL